MGNRKKEIKTKFMAKGIKIRKANMEDLQDILKLNFNILP